MSKVYDYYKRMHDDEIILSFNGGFTSDLLTSLIQVAESKLEKINTEPKIKKKILNVLVECLQNVYHHLDEDSVHHIDNSAILMIGREKDDYVIMTGNHLATDKVENLKQRIDTINLMSKDEIKELYRDILNNEQISDKGGAGLGMVDMVRKSGQKLDYDFTLVNETHSFYSLKVRIAPADNN